MSLPEVQVRIKMNRIQSLSKDPTLKINRIKNVYQLVKLLNHVKYYFFVLILNIYRQLQISVMDPDLTLLEEPDPILWALLIN